MTSVGGFTCPVCWNWVPAGCVHHCPRGFPQPAGLPVSDPAPTVTVDYSLMLILALNRLAAAIEALTATIQP